jgi:SAM-dependent methyltransferase
MSAIDSTSDDVDINVDDENATEPAPSVIPKPTASEPSIDSSRKPRPRMTLRIPDDEVVRPSQIPPEVRPTPSRAEIAPSRIITINPPPSSADVVTSAKPLGLVGMSAAVVPAAAKSAPRALESMGALDDSTALDVMPVTTSDPPPEPLQSSDAVELDEAESAEVLAAHRSQMLTPHEPEEAVAARPPSHTVPDVPEELPEEEPAPDSPRPEERSDPTIQVAAQTDTGDGEVDIPVDEDEPAPPSDAEIAPEDLVSVESMPRDEPEEAPQAIQYTPLPPVGMQSTPNLQELQAAAGAPVTPTMVGADGAATAGRPQLVIVPPHGSPLAPPPMNESSAAAAARKRARPWWEELFGDDFIRTMAKITDAQIYGECDFIEDSLGVAKGAMVLDLGCGTGRHAIELTRRGYQVVGYDLSLPMLARAADEAQERDQKLNFLQGDMRDMTFEDTFDGIYCWNTSFGFFEEEKNAQVITRVHKALRMGGQFLLDVINRDFLIRQAPSLAWFEGDGCICMDEMQIDWITSRMRVKRTMMMDDGRSKEIEYSVRVYSLHELGKILHDHGFRVAEVSGRTATPGVFFGNESPRTLILAEKR